MAIFPKSVAMDSVLKQRGHLLIPALIGAFSFAVYFARGEHHMYIVRYLQIFVLLTSSAIGFLVFQQHWQLSPAAAFTFQVATTYLLGLYLTRAVYRLLLHPLNKFPGAIGARLSSFWFSWQLRRSDCFRQLKSLHDQHGHIVRVGPNNLSIANPEAVQVVYGFGSKCTKAAWYDLTQPMVSLQTLRDKRLHDQRRRVWSAAFSDRMLRGYEQRLRGYRRKLMSHIAELQGRPINVTQWFNFYSFDFMGDLAFGQSFDLLQQGEHWALKLLSEALNPLAFAFPVWFFRVLTAVPGLTKDWWRFIDFCAERMQQRLNTKVDIPDIVTALSTELDGQQPTAEQMNLLRGDAQLIVVAGSDTTATTLTAAMWELAQHPKQIELLREEVAPFMTDPSGEVLNEKIVKLPHLNAIIDETLRLYPPVPSMLQRKTPSEGIVVDGEYIPGNTIVSCPQYVIGRNSAAYHDPEAFIPERWTTRPELVKVKRAFAPFSAGPFGCVGRPLALLTLRTTLARLVTEYDIFFAPGEDGTSFEGKATEKFTIGFGELLISFKKR